jgi:hypothetical protein
VTAGAATIAQALREHGVNPDTRVTVLSDGDAGFCAIQRSAAPEADLILESLQVNNFGRGCAPASRAASPPCRRAEWSGSSRRDVASS